MEWSLGVNWHRPICDPVAEGERAWTWIEALKPLHPALALWRPTADTIQLAREAPPMTRDVLLHRIRTRQQQKQHPLGFMIIPAFCGQLGAGSKLALDFGYPEPGDGGLTLWIGRELGDALDADEALADAIMTTSATILHPTLAALSSRKHPPRNTAVNGPAPYNYSAGWKMFFPTASPHWQRAHQLATRTRPVADGAILTYGTPDTYPDILNQWNSPPPPR